jgi:hypothetical protein
MWQEASQSSTGGTLGAVLVGLLALLSFYVLSIGPAASLVVPYPAEQWRWDTFNMVYAPVIVICHLAGLGPALSAYVGLWT